MTGADLECLRRAIGLSRQARADGRHPFAALVVAPDGTTLAEAGNNSVPPAGDPTQHAELRAAQMAFRAGTPAQLAGATLYTSAEPCAMCAGAIHWSGIGRVVFALSERALYDIVGPSPEHLVLPCRDVFARSQRPMEILGPSAALDAEARAVHAGFWTVAPAPPDAA